MVKSILEPNSWFSYFMHGTRLNYILLLYSSIMKSTVHPSQGYWEDPSNIQHLEQGLAQNEIVALVLLIMSNTQTSTLSP